MPKYGPHLKGIEKKAHSRLKTLDLVPKYIFDSKTHQERFYTVLCKDNCGSKVVFKMRTENFSETREYFRREIEINRMFTKCYGNGGKLSVPKFIRGDSFHTPEWMVYEFIDGFESGDFYNGLLKENILKFSIESFVGGLKNMHKMSAFAKGKISLKKEGSADFCKAYRKYASRLSPFFSDKKIEAAEGALCSSGSLLDNSVAVVSHGDLHPGNVVITAQGKIAIIDWYYVHLNNLAFDLAFFYLEIPDKSFQKKLLARFLDDLVKDENEFWQLFRLDILRLVPQKMNILCDALYTLDPKREDYYAKLTPKGITKMENMLAAFEKALEGKRFL